MDITNQIETLVHQLLREGVDAQEILWKFNSVLIKQCDIHYKLDRELPTSRAAEGPDLLTGDSDHQNDTTLEELDQRLEIYMAHPRDCKCYSITDSCPVCLDNFCLDQKIDCCGGYIHKTCLAECYQSGREKCPLCRHKLRLEKIGDDLMVVADIKPESREPTRRNFDQDDRFCLDRVNSHLETMHEIYLTIDDRNREYHNDNSGDETIHTPGVPELPSVAPSESVLPLGTIRIPGREELQRGELPNNPRHIDLPYSLPTPPDPIIRRSNNRSHIYQMLRSIPSFPVPPNNNKCQHKFMRGPKKDQTCDQPVANTGEAGSDEYCRSCIKKLTVQNKIRNNQDRTRDRRLSEPSALPAIQTIINQVGCTVEAAQEALVRSDGDIINAIMDLQFPPT